MKSPVRRRSRHRSNWQRVALYQGLLWCAVTPPSVLLLDEKTAFKLLLFVSLWNMAWTCFATYRADSD